MRMTSFSRLRNRAGNEGAENTADLTPDTTRTRYGRFGAPAVSTGAGTMIGEARPDASVSRLSSGVAVPPAPSWSMATLAPVTGAPVVASSTRTSNCAVFGVKSVTRLSTTNVIGGAPVVTTWNV